VFSCLLCIQLGMSLFLLFADTEAVYKALELLCTPNIWRIYVLIILVVSFCVSFFVEDAILQNYRLWLWIKALFRFHSSSEYRKLQRQLEGDASWPPMNQSDFAADRKSEAYINPIYENSDEN
ncbi:probable cation-transporting ATPase 13A5, partial [Sceloporus undulatus]|uniref:probable cation-transporting ATPase 13A5 n=1 Tax=Sceloporus undulatus TaxID=8520 RepID=UPI001C4AD168